MSEWTDHGRRLVDHVSGDAERILETANALRTAYGASDAADGYVVDVSSEWLGVVVKYPAGWACVALVPRADCDIVAGSAITAAELFASKWPASWISARKFRRNAGIPDKVVDYGALTLGCICWAKAPEGGVMLGKVTCVEPLTVLMGNDGGEMLASATGATWQRAGRQDGCTAVWDRGWHYLSSYGRLQMYASGFERRKAPKTKGRVSSPKGQDDGMDEMRKVAREAFAPFRDDKKDD